MTNRHNQMWFQCLILISLHCIQASSQRQKWSFDCSFCEAHLPGNSAWRWTLWCRLSMSYLFIEINNCTCDLVTRYSFTYIETDNSWAASRCWLQGFITYFISAYSWCAGPRFIRHIAASNLFKSNNALFFVETFFVSSTVFDWHNTGWDLLLKIHG